MRISPDELFSKIYVIYRALVAEGLQQHILDVWSPFFKYLTPTDGDTSKDISTHLAEVSTESSVQEKMARLKNLWVPKRREW